ncbi:hypothetical protein VCRA2121O157_130133 [Vibrio crassostreae]|jgi:hypothetical protein|nr:hypothetical protein VCRA2113O138_120019 [Vibrio crassostreae]CAK1743317.1 hypothetical protein VCRA2113O140_130019 [Vibrio crassostreae]CAK2251693.1 hypothetical protein VCRA2116O141_130019 [Vibrio crassostreae]CAK2600794.1 hypothetical protein VCRA2113O23_120031 [Vibrio crassostreae]CAK2610098.1 hypothetical protein VCRA2119O148_120137 [Vibrio crassostreae]
MKSMRFLDGLDDEHRDEALQHASLRPLISMWLAIVSNAILGLEADEDRRIWVLVCTNYLNSAPSQPKCENLAGAT